ncbi:MAG: ribosome small subunit-dependent GTPase A [Bacteroidales bacterium]|nr:ribosome small subunit-dependent GTPase A [Bacteroidales bacterium]
MYEGLVIKTTGSWHSVKTNSGQIISCTIKGRFRIKGIRLTNPVAVGDIVEFIKDDGQEKGVIVKIHPRKNYIIRKSINLAREAHILAANIDQALLMVSLREPTTFSMFIDRFLVSAEAYKIPVVLIFNKTDIYQKEDFKTLEEWKGIYEAVGYPCYDTSVLQSKGIDNVSQLLSGKISVISGNSGVGKSSLINTLLPEAILKTAEISSSHLTGKHTTTYPEMLLLEAGGYIIDTPGIRGFGIIDIGKEELYHFFPEIFEVSSNCKYHNCTHSHEPDCAVAVAVEEGKISFMRYNNYLAMLTDDDDKYRKTPW